MARPVTGEALLQTGIVLALYPRNLETGIEVQRAPDSSGSPDLGNLLIVGSVIAGVTTFSDVLPIDGALRHYRSRHRQGNAVSAWTGWVARVPTTIPDPLPGVVDLVPSIEVLQTISGTAISFTATATVGELEAGTVEFLDPERTFTAAGAITATDKTLTVTGGDFTDEDVNRYVSVADAGVAGGLLESRIDSVTSATVVELEDAATGTVSTKDVIVGGGFFDDFDYDSAAESSETNTRNRPMSGRDTQYITFRAVFDGEASSTQVITIQPTSPAWISNVDAEGFDDGADLEWDIEWTNEGATNSTDHDLTIKYKVNGVVVDQESGVSVDEAQPYEHTSVGEGGIGGTPVGSAIFELELKSTGADIFTVESTETPILGP